MLTLVMGVSNYGVKFRDFDIFDILRYVTLCFQLGGVECEKETIEWVPARRAIR